MKAPSWVFLAIVMAATVCFSVLLLVVLQTSQVDIRPTWIGMVFGGICILFFLIITNLTAKCLYPREAADLAVLGGVRLGSSPGSFLSQKGATWPFGKLLTTKDRLWIRTPWGVKEWDKRQTPRTRIEGGPLTPRLTTNVSDMQFLLHPWDKGKVEQTLISFGYDVSKE